jgi:heme exporter protein C
VKLVNKVLARTGSRGAQRPRGWATAVSLLATAVLGLLVVPPDAHQGDVQRLMYVHVPAAWLAFASFGVVFVASIAYLRTGQIRWDRVAVSSAEIGVQFCALTIVLGSLWGRPVWGAWWTWDPRLTTTAVLLLIYVGYLSLRRVADSPSRRAHWSAVVGVVGFVDVPIVHMSVVWWRSLHQEATVLRPGAPTMAPGMLATLLFATVAFSIAYAYLMAVRTRVGRVEDRAAGTILSRPTPRARVPRRAATPVGTLDGTPPSAEDTSPASALGLAAYAPRGGGDA